jgi:hypothetical protein
MSSLFKGKPVPSGPCQLTVLTCPLSLQQVLAPWMSSCGYTHRFCRKDGEKATSHRKELLTKLSNQRSHADMRLTCGSPVVCVCVCVCGGILNCFRQPAGRRKPVSSPGVEGHIVSPKFSRISFSAGRRACNQLLSLR